MWCRQGCEKGCRPDVVSTGNEKRVLCKCGVDRDKKMVFSECGVDRGTKEGVVQMWCLQG